MDRFKSGRMLITSSQFLIFYSTFELNLLLLSKITLSGNLCNFHMLPLNSLTNSFTYITSIVITKCIILNNLSYTTKITFFPATNSNSVMESTIRCIHGLFGTLLTINFPTDVSILFFIL